ncbi:MAG: divergent polysaccharide deacetylase family protein [Roseovarius sp.]
MTSLPDQAPPEAAEVEVPAASEFNQSREDTEAEMPAADETPNADSAPKVAAPEPDDLSSLEGADTAPASQPQTGSAESTLNSPEAQSGNSGVDVDSDEPVLPSPQSLAPEAPDSEDDLSISTEPAQPVQPEVEEDSGAFPVQEEAEADPDGDAETVPEVEIDDQDTGEAEPQEALPSEEETADQGAADVDMAGQDGTDEDMAVIEEVPEETSGTIGDLADGVTTDRLPSVSDDGVSGEDNPPPLQAYAAPFSNPDGKPLMAIVLIDDGSSPISFEALADFPYPISYAVDASWPGAAEAADKYRAAGLDVLAIADLPPGAGAADAEVAMQSYLTAVPEAVAVMEGSDGGLQSSRAATEQLIPILQDSGHGLVLYPNGLDTAQKLISRQGVPVVSVFRDFDGEGQDATVIRRFLDQAAFKAGQQEQGVVMVGRLRAETVSALLLWGLQDRAGSVALAPVSAVLKAEQ